MNMYFDWITWSIWSIGALILILWMFETIKEFRFLFSEHTDKKKKDN
jgi:hypothetical protein